MVGFARRGLLPVLLSWGWLACPPQDLPDAGLRPIARPMADAGIDAPDASSRPGMDCFELGHHHFRCVPHDADAGMMAQLDRAIAAQRSEERAKCSPRDDTGAFCVPDGGTMKAGVPLTVELVQPCGSKCDPSPLHCEVAVHEHQVDLLVRGATCNGRTGCPDECVRRRFTCALPPLDAGEWIFRSAGPDGGQGATLRLAAEGAVRCEL